ncbi:hypothetical protein K490DRAFT_35476 [Saccharata proteae CBS 121410]|uniref:N-acetylglucosamine-induced protein 1 n=1 Tax=Saccharata proteae CBS 121410 TaxID=1314787 RepID=A0A9P4HZU4_9PEZI|nr:hypothetical protein K490DRAFT_35476 [Saccharata proteae CBS 121410]
MPHSELPYWLVNVPRDQWPAECPEFLREVSEKDRAIIGTPDSEYQAMSWAEVQEIIKTNRIDLFQRKPSELRRYRHYTWELVQKYGSIMDFVVSERLKWADLRPSGPPFSNPDDLKILCNDWPYGLDERIVHLVVWTRFEMEERAEDGDLTAKARREIDGYVDRTFCSRVGAEKVIWFRNWRSLQSVHAVPHFHVMLYDADEATVREMTGGDVPLSAKVAAL